MKIHNLSVPMTDSKIYLCKATSMLVPIYGLLIRCIIYYIIIWWT